MNPQHPDPRHPDGAEPFLNHVAPQPHPTRRFG